MNGYQCPGCLHYIGLICDGDKPGQYRCPHVSESMSRTGTLVHDPQQPIKRDTPKKPREIPLVIKDRVRDDDRRTGEG